MYFFPGFENQGCHWQVIRLRVRSGKESWRRRCWQRLGELERKRQTGKERRLTMQPKAVVVVVGEEIMRRLANQ